MKNRIAVRAFLCCMFSAAAVTPVFAEDHKITQSDKMFSQMDIKIKVGDTLTFVNADEVTHNVYSVTPGMGFDLQRQAPGASSKVPFAKEGTAEVQCSIHPKMKLLVHVQK